MKKTVVAIVKTLFVIVFCVVVGYMSAEFIDSSDFMIFESDLAEYALQAWVYGSLGYTLTKGVGYVVKNVKKIYWNLEKWSRVEEVKE